MIYIGIDPGEKGAIAVLHEGGAVAIGLFEDGKYADILRDMGTPDVRVCLEHVTAMPGQGVTSMFNFGVNFGYIRGILEAFKVPYELVRPAKWKKEFSITGDKNSSIDVCKRLFPDVTLKRTEKSKKNDDGIAEALLMAEYARRRL